MIKWMGNFFNGAPVAPSTTAGTFIAFMDALIAGYGSKTLASLTVSSNVATAVVTGGHGFYMCGSTGSVIKVEGATPSGLNGEHRITVVDPNTFTFPTTGISDVTASGTITAKVAGLDMVKAFTSTNKAAYKFTSVLSTGVHLRIDNTMANSYVPAIMYETMSSIDVGTNGTPASSNIMLTYGETLPNWIVVADERILYLLFLPGSANNAGGFIFGDTASEYAGDMFNGTIHYSGTTVSDSYTWALNTTTYGFICKSYSQLGNVVSSAKAAHYLCGSTAGATMGSGTVPYPGLSNTAMFAKVHQLEGTRIRAWFPGMYASLHPASAFSQGQSISVGGRDLLIAKNTQTCVAFDITGPWRT